jgi:Na+/H+ antiporter NhaD/arsenite permease-like protein
LVHAHSHLATPTDPFGAWLVAPFALLLLAIAALPLAAPRFWGRNLNKGLVAAALSVPVLAYYLDAAPGEIAFHLDEYLAFIVLLWALYTVSGGIVLRGNLAATPGTNTAMLAVAAVIANVFGTTGASMLLIRPMLRTNQERKNKTHVFVFFIFIASNLGGALTPLGDPPLYMGFLHGIPFAWTLRFWPAWLFANGVLLAVFWLWDRRAYAAERPEDVRRDVREAEPLRVAGWTNVVLILAVLAANLAIANTYLREGAMVALGAASILLTAREHREANSFSWHAIVEVAVLFAGIFVTMIPALVLLEQNGPRLGVTEPWQYFWATGSLSSFLDNTPTYLTFLSLAKGAAGTPDAAALISTSGGAAVVSAISLGAVFMGANTYVGNGPNFMVKAIAEADGPTRVRMPSFGGYMLYSAAILLPLFVVVTLVFLRRA